MTEHEPPDTPQDFEKRLQAARARRRPADFERAVDQGSRSSLGLAFRIGVELVSTLAVGVGIGWLFDSWLGTAPLFLVLFFFLGAGAGVLNVFRAVSGLGLGPGRRRKDRNANSADETES